MLKLFFTLYLMVLASFIVLVLYVGSIFLVGESFGEGKVIEEKVSKGTFMLLNQSLESVDSSRVKELVHEYKKLFGDEFNLVDSASMSFSPEQLQLLKKGKVLSVEEENILYLNAQALNEDVSDIEETITILYFQSPIALKLWRAHLDYGLDLKANESGFTVIVTLGNFSKGMMHLLEKKLKSVDESSWSDYLDNFQVEFGLPLSLKDVTYFQGKLKNNPNQLSLLSQNKIVNVTQGIGSATQVKRIPNTNKLLQVGPIDIPWYIRFFPLFMVLAFILAFATTSLLWLWPLWSSLIKIKKTAGEFGAGNYDARIKPNILSPIKNISNAFNSMAEHTQRSIRSQKELTSAVSHELRTPVARMRFALEMLNASNNKEDQLRYANAINEDINELDLLLEELLNYARFDQKNTQLNPSLVKIIPWIEHSMEKLMPLTNGKELRYVLKNIETNESSHFEPRLMSRVLDNLVQNALRYAKNKVKVTFKKGDESYILVVEDDGDGIPEDKREHIFDAFSRIDASRDRASGGFGLGLAIVDRIIKAHQGNISIHTSYLGGARFEVRLPRK